MRYEAITLDQIPDVAGLLAEMLAGTMFEPPTYDKMARIIESPDWFTLAAFDGEQMVGFMAGACCETFLNHEYNAYERGLFVLPSHRKTGAAATMVRAFEEWARGKGASKCWIGQSVNQDRDGVLRFFQSLGYECQGFITCKKL